MQGDIILFKGAKSNLIDRAVMWRTHGPFVHVEVDVGNGKSVAALTHGIVLHDVPANGLVIPTSTKLKDKTRLARGVNFALDHVGDKYGWLDIADQAWSVIFPYGPFVVSPHQLDCSDLCSSFLWIAGYPLPIPDVLTSMVSPNDLARALAPAFPGLLG